MHVARSSLSRSTGLPNMRLQELRGIHKVAGEFTLVSLTHNLLKLWRANPVAAGSSNLATKNPKPLHTYYVYILTSEIPSLRIESESPGSVDLSAERSEVLDSSLHSE